MHKFKDKKQFRYKGYDYSQDGYYFVTICTQDKELFFGEVIGEEMKLSEIGLIADNFWQKIPDHFKMVKLHEYIIMPNHVHGIIEIDNDICGGTLFGNISRRNAPRRVPTIPPRVPTGIQPLVKNSLSSIINHYKGNVKKCCNKNDFEYFTWQSRFHDRIIRNEKEFINIRQYILNNPLKWYLDRNNQENGGLQ